MSSRPPRRPRGVGPPFYVIRETLCYTKQLNFDLMHIPGILRGIKQKDNRLTQQI